MPQTPIDLTTPQAPPPAVSGADVVTALDARLAELQATVAALVDKAVDTKFAASPAAQASIEIDPDVLESSRTLQLAKRTADATIADAQAEAGAILSSAQSEREVVLREAHEAADRELGAQRAVLAEQTSSWEARRVQLIGAFERLDVELAEQQSLIEEARRAVAAALSGQALSTPIPMPDSPESPTAAVVPETLAHEQQPAEAPTFDPPPAPFAEPTVEPPAPPPAPDAPPAPVFGAPADEAAETQVTTFGTPPEPAPTPFYPWSRDEQETQAELPPEPPAEEPRPVQRRGLFGH